MHYRQVRYLKTYSLKTNQRIDIKAAISEEDIDNLVKAIISSLRNVGGLANYRCGITLKSLVLI